MTRRRNRLPFNMHREGEYGPKRLTRGLRRHLKKVRRQNPAEAARQEDIARG